jgi:hypothetical protein
MYIIPIAWIYVALMMAVAEATSSNGSLLGALMTFVLYGVLPIGLVLYFMGSPARRRAIRARENQEVSVQSSPVQPNASSETPTDAVSPVRKEP